MMEAEELRPVPREQAVLESFFTQLGMFSFDRAKEYVEKEKDNSKSAGGIWAALAHLAAAEKAYHNMTFLGQKMGAYRMNFMTMPTPKTRGSARASLKTQAQVPNIQQVALQTTN